MINLSSTLPNQIRFLLQNLNEANADSVFRELCEFMKYGIDGSVAMLQTCLDYLHFHRVDLNNPQLEPVLVSIFKFVLEKPNFCTVFCLSLEGSNISEEFLENLCNVMHLSLPEKISIGLALFDSENPDTRTCGRKFCMVMVEELCANPVPINSADQIQNIVLFLQRSEGLSKHVDHFLQMLSLMQSKDVLPFFLTPLVTDELREDNFLRRMNLFHGSDESEFDAILAEMEKEMSMGDIVKELGYGCTSDASYCMEILSMFLPLTEITISKILGTITQSHSGLEDNQSIFSTFGVALGCSISTDLPPLSSWDIEILMKTINHLAPDANWTRVIENLDHEGFYVPNEEAFAFLMSAYRLACQDPFPLHAVCGSVWKNTEGQLSFLRYAVLAPPEVFTFAHSGRLLTYIDAGYAHKLQVGEANQAWLCLDLLDILCQLAERGHTATVRSLLEHPLKHYPEVLLLGLSHVNTAYNLVQGEVSISVFPMVFKSTTGSGIILHLWNVSPNLVVRGLVDIYNAEPNNLTRIVDICQELKILPSVLEMIPSPYAVRLAALASRKELIDLDKWLLNNLVAYKDIFFEECLKFLKEVQLGGSHEFSAKPFQHTSKVVETTTTFLKVLKSHTGLVTSAHLFEELERLNVTVMDSDTRLQNGDSVDSSTHDGYPPDVEREANSYFHQMFSGQLAVDVMVQMLARFKESLVKREQLIFGCMISNLFEEYKFFSKYPERQLKIAAVLFGSVIKHQLVTHLTLGIALRGVLDALRKPPDSKMYVFGTKALEQFVDRMIEWPQYCNHILQISNLRGTHSELVAFIERALARISSGHLESDGSNNASAALNHGFLQATSGNGETNGVNVAQPAQQLTSALHLQQRNENILDDRHKASSAPFTTDNKQLLSSGGQSSVASSNDAPSFHKSALSSSSLRTSRGAPSARFGSALSIETLVAAAERRETPLEAPASEIQDKISFTINNLSAANVEAKAKELADILKEQYYPWFAQYMVMKRASIEPNFHDLYLKFLDKFNSKALNKEIIQATYENCKVLLGSERIKSMSEERSLLKNLGSWLGKLTIGRNQVLRAREIDPKSLIIEAYEKGLMIAVIPFTSKILEPCQSSLAYQPPNPWTMGILGLLAEIYSMPNLKMNLKFDIEVLFKNLDVNIKDITPTSLLKDRKREIEGNPDFSIKDVGPVQIIPENKPGVIPPMNHSEPSPEVPSPPNSSSHTHLASQYPSPVHISPGLLIDDEKMSSPSLPDQLPPGQGLFQPTLSQSPFSVSQLSTTIPNIGTHVIINQKLTNLGLHIPFQRVVPVAMDRAIKEIVSGIVQRSVSIATQTTKELVLKDYAMESDETRIYNAAHLMVASLAGSLAHVTCKEPLRSSILNHLRSSIQGLSIASDILEPAVQLVTNDNLDLGCAIIEQAATDKAIQTIDTEIAQQLALRRKHRDGVGPTFFDGNMYSQSSMGVVPEALRPKPGHLSTSQQRVYEDFVRLPWQSQSSQTSHAVSTVSSAASGGISLASTYGSVSGQLNSVYSSTPGNVGNVGFEAVSHSLDMASETVEPNSASLLSTSPIHIAATDGVIQQSSENNSAPASSEILLADSFDAVKEPGGSQPSSLLVASDHIGVSIIEPSLNTRDALDKYQILAQKLEALVVNDAGEAEIQEVVAEVPEIILRCVSRDEAALAVAQKVFKGLYENASNSVFVNYCLAILAAIRDVCKLVVKELTSWVIYSDEERKFNIDITVGLIRSELLNMSEYSAHMAKLIDGGRNKAATEFSISLIQALAIEESKVIFELHNLVDALVKLSAKPGSPESLQQLIEMVRNPVANTGSLSSFSVGKEDKARQPRDKKATNQLTSNREDYSVEAMEPDPAGFREQVSMLFADWYRICELPGANDAALTHFILQLHQSGLLKGDDVTDRFFRILMELSVVHCISSDMINTTALQSTQQVQNLSFLAIDIYAKLVYSILKVEQGSNKLFLLGKILGVIVRYMQNDLEEKKTSFNPRPYFRLFICWLVDLVSLDPVVDGANFQILTAFANTFHSLQPLKVPAFSFAWLELVSHRSFMPKLLTVNAQKGWPFVQRLLLDLFQFLEPFLRNAELGPPVQFLYKGTLRVLLVLLHDFPEFLCDYHFTFCDVIPPSCIQMRNIILSAFPRNMRLPDPSTPNLKIDLLPEIREPPHILSEVDAALKAKQMKADVDEYLKTRQPGSSFPTELKQRLLLPTNEAASSGTHYNVPLINSLVLYSGMQAIQQLQARTSHTQPAGNNVPVAAFLVDAALDIYQTLILELDTEGRYLFLNAVANQLRYPNNHTHYFSFVLLYLFAESNQEIIQEQITRVLLERLIVNRPHPWGLLITFTELIKNPRYNFWNRSFIRCAPEIEKLFESVARSCGGLKPIDDSMVSGWASDNAH